MRNAPRFALLPTPSPFRSARASCARKPPLWRCSPFTWPSPATGAYNPINGKCWRGVVAIATGAFQMTTRTEDTFSRPIESRADLISVFEGGAKPHDDWRIGTEHEKFVYRVADHRAPSYDEPGGIRDLLIGLTEFGWKPVVENGNVIALAGSDGTISL